MTRSPLFFHQDQFVNRQGDQNIHKLVITDSGSYLNYAIDGSKVKSLPRSPFGGFHLESVSDANRAKNGLEKWLGDIPDEIKEVRIQLFPEIYDPSSYQVQLKLFKEIGFEVAYADISQYIEVNQGRQFNSIIASNQRRLLDQSNIHFEELGIEELKKVYVIISNNLETKGYPVTMSFDEIHAEFQRFPDLYRLFGVFIGDQCIAGSIVVQVSDKVIYDAYHGHDPNYSKLSPVVILMNGLYNFAKHNGFNYLDLGVSTVKGVKNNGLYAFKKRLGAQDSPKALLVYRNPH